MGRRVARLIAPKALGNLIVGGVVPSVLFLAGRRTAGLAAAVALTAGWNCSWQALRWLKRKPLSGLLMLGMLELGLRTTVGLTLHSARLFFLAPAVATAITGAVYIVSSARSRPLLAMVVADLVPTPLVDLSHPAARDVIRRLSILYGAEQILVATISVLMILDLTTTQYVAAHMIVSWSVGAVVLLGGVAAFRRELTELVPTPTLYGV